MRGPERPDFVSVVVLGIAGTMAGYVAAFVASGMYSTWVWNVLEEPLKRSDPVFWMGFVVTTFPAWLGLAVGGRIYDGSAEVVVGGAMALVAALLAAVSDFFAPDSYLVGGAASVAALALLGASSIDGGWRRRSGGIAGGLVAGGIVGFAWNPSSAWLTELAVERFLMDTPSLTAMQLTVTLAEAIVVGGLFWTLVAAGERLADR